MTFNIDCDVLDGPVATTGNACAGCVGSDPVLTGTIPSGTSCECRANSITLSNFTVESGGSITLIPE